MTEKVRDELADALRRVCLQDFLAALLWLARDEEGKIPQSDQHVVGFLHELSEAGFPGAPARIKELFTHVWFYREIGGSYSRRVDSVLSSMRGCHYFEHPSDTRSWRRVCKGQNDFELFTSKEQEYIEHLAEEFRTQHPVRA